MALGRTPTQTLPPSADQRKISLSLTFQGGVSWVWGGHQPRPYHPQQISEPNWARGGFPPRATRTVTGQAHRSNVICQIRPRIRPCLTSLGRSGSLWVTLGSLGLYRLLVLLRKFPQVPNLNSSTSLCPFCAHPHTIATPNLPGK